jgi:hypothetical protein
MGPESLQTPVVWWLVESDIPYVTEVIRTYTKNHKKRTAQNNNQLITDLFNQPEIGRRLNRMRPEDLIR